MSLKEEFEKAYWAEFHPVGTSTEDISYKALWAARWMAERCAKEVEKCNGRVPTANSAASIRALGKELHGQ